jgi:hypothetical protein
MAFSFSCRREDGERERQGQSAISDGAKEKPGAMAGLVLEFVRIGSGEAAIDPM